MYLNLKNKRLIEGITHPNAKNKNHPRTHRDNEHERQSREQKELKSTRQGNTNKKQTASTAMTTLQHHPTYQNKSYNNLSHHFVMPRPESLDQHSRNLIN